MTMNKALKLVDLEVEATALPENVTVPSNALDADAIRAKIKAARLEKLMARQLESELSLEIEDDLQVNMPKEEVPMAEEPLKTAPAEETARSDYKRPDTPASKSRGYTLGSSKRMRNIQTTRTASEDMLANIRSGADLFASLNERTNTLVNQLSFIEQEFVNFEEAEIRAAKIAEQHKRVTAEYEEALDLIEKQNRQLNVLESQRAASNSSLEATRKDLEIVQRQYEREADLLSESKMINSELEQENKRISKRLDASLTQLDGVNIELQQTNNELKQKDMEAARANAELASTREKLTNSEATLHSTTVELEDLTKQFTDAEIKLQSTQSQLNSANERLSSSERLLEATQRELETVTADLHEKDMANAKMLSDYTTLHKTHNKALSDLENVQTKYDELNKSALAQQSQQYARIHELESVLRETKRQLQLATKSNSELSVELEATNNLLVLHEEMVSALSPREK